MAEDGGRRRERRRTDGAKFALRSHSHRHGDRKIEEAGDPSKGVDSISSLPDVILQSILSSLPTSMAIRTSILSKRWRHVWSDTPSLSFDFTLHRPEADSINKTLDRYTARKMMSFRLCANTSCYTPHIDRWIEFAMSRNMENMSLQFRNHGGDKYHVPDFFYINNSVKQLSVHLMFYGLRIPSCSVFWTSLKKLSLHVSDEGIDKILSGCPILESLKLYFCNELRVLDVRKSQRLRTLEISCSHWVPGPTQIVAPQIHCLRLKNYLLPCTFVDVSSLTEASLDLCFFSTEKLTADFLQDMFLKMLVKLQNVDKLTFGASFLKVLSIAELRGVPFPSFKVKDLTFDALVSQYVTPGLVRLLQNSPELKKLTVRTMDSSTIQEAYIHDYLNSQGLNLDQSWSSEARVIENVWNVESKHVALFMELMLKSTKTLEKMVVMLKGYIARRKFEELLEMVPMLSHNNNNVSICLATEPNII
ncbi:unnamed protein product [Thlaspi arvense]|uniref:F-box domain-containing protein n=1 Tax=Thlaspi arvense TaxID=13288 RepID=A0AAU9S9U9_THLAR|nr:unnamed protein product [Thlaspi arvense]